MAFSFLRKLHPRRRRDANNIAEPKPSPHPAPKMRGKESPTQQHNPHADADADTHKTEKHHSGCGLYTQPADASKTDADQSHDVQAFIERNVDPSDQEPAFTWQDIEPSMALNLNLNPPPIDEFFNYELSPAEKDNLLDMHTHEQLPPRSRPKSAPTLAHMTTAEEQARLAALHRAVQVRLLGISSTPPSYNDVSGAVVVDDRGLPHFLSPQEEEERQASLRQAVEERMLGLPRRTKFSWAQASRGTPLPAYASGTYK